MTTVLHVKRVLVGKRLSVRKALRFLGAESARFQHEAHAVWRDRIVAARRTNDDEQVISLNSVWAFLKKTMFRKCGCGETISADARWCRQCYYITIRPKA